MEDNKRKYIQLLEAFYKGETSAEDEALLRDAFERGVLDESALDEYYRERWNAAEKDMDPEIQRDMLEKLRAKAAIPSRRKTFGHIFRNIAACAACMAIGILGTWAILDSGMKKDSSKQYAVITEKGQKTTVMLPDGTTVWLNSDSRLTYDMSYDKKERNVRLEGEGYFEVAKDGKRPFTVYTKEFSVTALGTAFNISSYDEDATAVTTLVEGKVRVVSDGIDTQLTENQCVTYDRTSGEYTKGTSGQAYGAGLWRDNELVVSPGTTLETFAVILERNYNISFEFRDESIKDYKFEGIIKNSQLTNVLELISISAPVSYRIEENKVILDRNENDIAY